MALQNVNIYHGKLVPTGLKVPVAQYELDIEIQGDLATDIGSEKKQKRQVVLFPDVLVTLSPEELEDFMRQVLVQYARADTEKTAAAKEK